VALSTKIGVGLGSCILALCSGCSGLRTIGDEGVDVTFTVTPHEHGCLIEFSAIEHLRTDIKDVQVNPTGGGS
jgi:hypothetical protein